MAGEKEMKRNEKTIYVGKGTKLTIIEEKSLPPGTIIIEGAMPVDMRGPDIKDGKGKIN